MNLATLPPSAIPPAVVRSAPGLLNRDPARRACRAWWRESLGPLGLSRPPPRVALPGAAAAGGRTTVLIQTQSDGSAAIFMHARQLVELAALVSVQGPVLVRGTGRISKTSMEQYWIASKSRQDRWAQSLKGHYPTAVLPARPSARLKSSLLRSVVEEILTGEVLTRVWTAVTCAYDRHHGIDLAEPIARSVLTGHLEARHRVLTLLVCDPGFDTEQAVKLNRLRRRTERWTDMLIGHLAELDDVSEFAIDPYRAKDYADDLGCRSGPGEGQVAWPIVLASLRAAFGGGLSPASPNADLNARIAASIVACFRSGFSDFSGLCQSAWLVRLSNVANDAQEMIDELLALDEAPSRGGRVGLKRGRPFDH